MGLVRLRPVLPVPVLPVSAVWFCSIMRSGICCRIAQGFCRPLRIAGGSGVYVLMVLMGFLGFPMLYRRFRQ